MSNYIRDLMTYDLVKICSKCGIIQLKMNFFKDKSRKDGLYVSCKSCHRMYYNTTREQRCEYNKRYYQENCDNLKRYYQENRDQKLEYYKKYNYENRDKKKRYYQENREQILEIKKRYRKESRDKICEYENNRRQTDPMYKFTTNLRTRTRQAFKAQNMRKNNKTLELLGCSQQFLKRWIEFQLYGDMKLENYGKVWHIDHCLPISSFNLFNQDEIIKCFNWKNLRPMYSKDNIQKVDKVNIRLYLLQEIKAYYFLKVWNYSI